MATTFRVLPITFTASGDSYSDAGRSVSLTSFWGGAINDRCCQLTLDGGRYVPLTKEDAIGLASALLLWASGLDSDRLADLYEVKE